MGVPSGPVAIIAGGGGFPLEVARSARAAGHDVRILALRGFASRALKAFPMQWADMLDPARLLDALRDMRPGCVVLAGSVTRPGPLAVTSIYAAFRNREQIARVLAGGDDRLLKGVVAFLEENGFPVVGAHAVAPDVLAPAGPLGARPISSRDASDVGRAADLLDAIGCFDVGQGAVVSDGRVLAVEGPEGTDAMLERVATLQRRRRVVLDGKGAVLVKRPKPGQDLRVDLPAIGPRTVSRARAAGLSAIAVEAGGVVIIEREATVEAADRAGVAIHGFTAQGGSA